MSSLKNTSSRFSLGNKPKHLIVGFQGEVGRALWEIFNAADPISGLVAGVDVDSASIGIRDIYNYKCDVMHICIPYTENFVHLVKEYQKQYGPKVTIIHSTVPVGVSRSLRAVHSPIRGIHPNLKEGILAFPKFLGGKQASLVADIFRRVGIKVIVVDKSETTEALKLFDTQYYLECVRFCHKVKEFCDKNDLPFSEVYTLSNQTYNEGYTKLGMPEVVRPVLQPIMGKVGGHCLLPNEELLYGKAEL